MSADDVQFVETPLGVELELKVSAGAARTRVTGVFGTALRISVNAPREAGKANEAARRLLAECFGLRVNQVELLSGQSSPRKRLRLSGINAPRARERLAAALSSA